MQAQREQSVRQGEALLAAAEELATALRCSKETAAAADEAYEVRSLFMVETMRKADT